jgi:hypothetical protein
MEISFTVCSLSAAPVADFVEMLEENIGDVSFEVVVVCPETVSFRKTRHIPETSKLGNVRGHNLAFEHCEGGVVIACNLDTVHLWDGRVLLEKLAEKEKVAFPFCGGLNPLDNELFGTCYGRYYPYFPVMTRGSIKAIGGWFNDKFIDHFGDPDIGMRTWWHNGRCELLAEHFVISNPPSQHGKSSRFQNNNFVRDFGTFKQLWHSKFGFYFNTDFRDINVDYCKSLMRQNSFNLALPPKFVSRLISRHQI